ncbi:phospholipase A and acyltransferase 4-like [Siniperca chuatsi]|uniref:phospholipase A and acyltransferase 4-like n=1 Tax=Siniperca chuatsi TaxID=119488 RepID=UPI001CE08C6B|nr:phospholipase A and acyltransferase 4-like [Siniperca chuatsi]
MAPTMFDNGAKPGDLIEIFRGTYEHWAVYIGGNEVVHLIPSDDSGAFGNLLMLVDSRRAQVRRQKIWEVAGSNDFKINNFLDDEYQPRERHIIVREACRMVGEELPYSVATYNCEHFVTELRYGKPESRQVKTAAVIGGVAAAGVGIVALGAVLFSLLKDDDERRHHK